MLIETVDLLTGTYHLKYVSNCSSFLSEHDGHHNAGNSKTGKGAPDSIKSKGSLQTNGLDSVSKQQLEQLVAFLVSALTELEKVLYQSIASMKALMKELEDLIRYLPQKKQVVIKKILESVKSELNKDEKDLSHVLSIMAVLEQELKKPSLLPDGKMLGQLLSEMKGLEKEIYSNMRG